MELTIPRDASRGAIPNGLAVFKGLELSRPLQLTPGLRQHVGVERALLGGATEDAQRRKRLLVVTQSPEDRKEHSRHVRGGIAVASVEMGLGEVEGAGGRVDVGVVKEKAVVSVLQEGRRRTFVLSSRQPLKPLQLHPGEGPGGIAERARLL
jgi:hypothetical protein